MYTISSRGTLACRSATSAPLEGRSPSASRPAVEGSGMQCSVRLWFYMLDPRECESKAGLNFEGSRRNALSNAQAALAMSDR